MKAMANSSMPSFVQPLPDLLQALRSQNNVSQLLLRPMEEEVVCRTQIQQIRGVLEQLDLIGGYPHLNDVGNGEWRMVPMKEPLLDEPLAFLEDVMDCSIGHPDG